MMDEPYKPCERTIGSELKVKEGEKSRGQVDVELDVADPDDQDEQDGDKKDLFTFAQVVGSGCSGY